MKYTYNRTTKRMVITARNGADITRLRKLETELAQTGTYFVVTEGVGAGFTRVLELPLIPQAFVDSLGK